jgi:uncharacterized cupredoxin-like copper-binding protein
MKRILPVALIALLAATSSVAGAQAINVTLNEFTLKVSKDTVKAGKVSFHLVNEGRTTHNLRIEGGKIEKTNTRELAKGEAATWTLELTCPLAEGTHKMAGMKATLVVIPATPTKATKKP